MNTNTIEPCENAATRLYVENHAMTSVVSQPSRCQAWGDRTYRGNCDGTLIKDLVLRYGARTVADPMMGSGTSRDVVAGLNRHVDAGVGFWGADLQTGFDLLREEIPDKHDFVWVHPPYWNIVRYTDDPADLSNATSYEDFIRKLYVCMKRCGKALNAGGRLAVLVGDVRKQGRYFPIVREVMNMERDLGDLRSVIIKVQHNCTSDGKNYGRLEDVPIKHEYCIVFKARSVGAGSAHGTAA